MIKCYRRRDKCWLLHVCSAVAVQAYFDGLPVVAPITIPNSRSHES
jgi:hypothetical protein